MLQSQEGPHGLIQGIKGAGSCKERRKRLGILFTFWWQLWKGRNRRIFEAKEILASALAGVIKDEVLVYRVA
jgi:hypothetical protein